MDVPDYVGIFCRQGGGVANFLGERPIEFPEIAWRSLALIKVAISNFRKLSRMGLELGLYPITES